jgi:hypothetical protein
MLCMLVRTPGGWCPVPVIVCLGTLFTPGEHPHALPCGNVTLDNEAQGVYVCIHGARYQIRKHALKTYRDLAAPSI